MANKILGITVDIEGKTSGLTKSLQEANSSINKTTAALKDVDKALKLDPTNVELLAQKEALLTKQIEQTSEKLDVMRQVATDANAALERGDITEEQYASLTAEIVKTEASLSDLETEANSSGNAMEQAGDQAEDAGGQAEDAGDKYEGLGKAAETAGKVASTAMKAAAAAAAALGAAIVAGTAAAGKGLVSATSDTSKLADELGTLSKTTGLSTKTLQELNYASELLDVSTQTITGSMTKMQKTMASDKGAEKFKALGISVRDASGQLKSTEDVFWDSIDALGKISNESERDAKAMELFGKSAKELNPLILAGKDGFRQLADEASRVGYVMSDETIDKFGQFDDNMQRLKNSAQAVKQSMGGVLLPVLSDLSGEGVDLLGEFSGALAQTDGDVDKMASTIESFAPKAVSLIQTYFPKILTVVQSVLSALLPAVMSVAPQLISMVGTLIEQLANSISQNADSFITAFTSLFTSLTNSIATLLPVIIPLAVQLLSTLCNSLIENAPLLIDGALQIIDTLVTSFLSEENITKLVTGATAIITGLLDGLTQALPILIPAAIDAVLTFVETLLSENCLSQILKAALTLIITLAQSLITYLPKLIERLPEIITGIVKFLTGDALPQIIEAGVTLLLALITNLPKIIVEIVKALGKIVVEMGSYIVGEGKDKLLKSIGDAFGKIISAAAEWGSDMIKSFIDGIKAMIGKLTSAVKNVAKTIADFLHFSEPDLGPLSDFSESGGDMIDSFIKSMEREQPALARAMSQTAAIVGAGWNAGETSMLGGVTPNYEGNMARIEQAISAVGGTAGSGTWVFPIYIGGEHVDTLVVDALDRNNYLTGGH